MKVGVMASGRGSNFQAIIDAGIRGEMPDVEIVHLIVNKVDAYAIERAKKHGINFDVVDSSTMDRDKFDQKVIDLFREKNIEVVVLAGFMRILTPIFIKTYRNKILNIHPSLLPAFPGAHAHRDTINNGAKISGCTAHLVDEGIDSGPIIMQASIEVENGETEDSLSAKILIHEHEILPKALQLLCSDKLIIIGRKVEIKTD
ncbi:MAG TPA: phosphoribosylglycinamide formyltransferase [Marine Group III euryarchaeote]|jgi:phosphoribosylglycinamide formyltransferase-1|uniref:phosphoribosylglycinamide formyltransferase 1 n=1 Tax=Marine Group III euryarchaeote TaxID=2173149 RepID=A0A7J4GSI8_9ARCH|nr:phosphoribosylglycinamide formyltransferase [Marine Group III euryarchaeote]